MNEWMNDVDAVTQLSASCFLSAVQSLSFSAGGGARHQVPTAKQGKGIWQPPISVQTLNVIVYFLSVPYEFWVICRKRKNYHPKSIKKLHKGLAEENKSIQPKHLQPRLCNFSSLWKSSDSISHTCLTLITAFSLSFPAWLLTWDAQQLFFPIQGCPKTVLRRNNSQGESVWPSSHYLYPQWVWLGYHHDIWL